MNKNIQSELSEGVSRREELEGILANHDCHAGEEDSCQCSQVIEELEELSANE